MISFRYRGRPTEATRNIGLTGEKLCYLTDPTEQFPLDTVELAGIFSRIHLSQWPSHSLLVYTIEKRVNSQR